MHSVLYLPVVKEQRREKRTICHREMLNFHLAQLWRIRQQAFFLITLFSQFLSLYLFLMKDIDSRVAQIKWVILYLL